MEISKLFNVPVPQVASDPGVAPPDAPATVPTFITAQSLATFPGATLAVTLIWYVGASLYDPLEHELVPFLASLSVGAFIYYISVSDEASVITRREKRIGIGVAFLNSLQIFAAVVGISLAAIDGGNESPPVPTEQPE
jgi:hypothetical protein